MPFRCEARGHHSFCHRPENRPFSWPALSRRSEPFGCSSRSLLRIAGWRICQQWRHILYTPHTLTKNPAILYQGVPLFCSFARFSAHLDEKTAISLLRSTKATASRCESKDRHSLIEPADNSPCSRVFSITTLTRQGQLKFLHTPFSATHRTARQIQCLSAYHHSSRLDILSSIPHFYLCPRRNL